MNGKKIYKRNICCVQGLNAGVAHSRELFAHLVNTVSDLTKGRILAYKYFICKGRITLKIVEPSHVFSKINTWVDLWNYHVLENRYEAVVGLV